MKNTFASKVLTGAFALALASVAHAQTITNPGFDISTGQLPATLDLNIFDGPPGTASGALGSTGWYGLANATSVLNIGFRGGVEVNAAPNSLGVGMISYGLGVNLGGLIGLEMPDAYLWQPLTGVSFQPNTTYTFSIDMTSSSLLDVTALGNRGFGIGLTSGSTTSDPGTFVADSLGNPGLLSVNLLGGNKERLTVSFTTGSTAPTGDIGVAVFAGRGTQTLDASLLNDFTVDNAALAVPEPSSGVLMLGGLGVLMHWSRRRKVSTAAI